MQNRAGQQLGNYRLKQRLDGGGYADVYLAEQIYLGMDVAVKVLKSPTLTPVEREKFLVEAKMVAKLDHPHIVKILEFGIETSQQDAHNIPFLVMDYAPLGTLRKHHPRGTRVPPEKIALYVKQLADALAYADDTYKIVHRDVKPENMLIKRADYILLSDFGIAVTGFNTGNLPEQLARAVANQSEVLIPGTPTYIAPERISDRPTIQRSSDQYSLAIVVYEWLTGAPPFTGSDPNEICKKHLTAAPPSLSKPPHNIAPEIEDVVMKALAKKSEFRYKTIKEFASALEEAVQLARARQFPPVAPYRPPQPNQTPPWVAPQQQQSPWSIPPQQPAQPVQSPGAGLVAANQLPRQAMQAPPQQFSQEQTPVRPPPTAHQQQPVPMPQPPNTPPWTQPTQARGQAQALPPQMPGSQPTGAQPALFQQAPAPGPGLQGQPPQGPGQPMTGMSPQGPGPNPSSMQGQSPIPPGAGAQPLPPQGPPGNAGQGYTWAFSNAPWHQGGYIPINGSGNTTNSNMTASGGQGQQQGQGQTANAYTTNNIAATAREFADGLSKPKHWLQRNAELDTEFFKQQRFRLLRWPGLLASLFAITLVGLFLNGDWWGWFFGIGFATLGWFLCITAVRKPLAIFGGVIVAFCWMYIGYGIDLKWPPNWMHPPLLIAQISFFAISLLIHIQYVLRKSE